MNNAAARMLAALCLLCSVVFGQIRNSTITGTISDPSGAAVVGAQVTITETRTNQNYVVTTSESGEYQQPYLPVGTYIVKVRRDGFKSATTKEAELTTSQTIRVDIKLEVGAVDSTVTVSAAAAELQTESSRVINGVDERTIRAIPNINNNPLNYAALQPGVVSRASMNSTQTPQSFGIGTEGRRAVSNFSVNGGAAFGNDIQLDGVSIQASAWNEVAILPNSEGIQEVKTTTNNFSAEYGRSQGTVIFTTKSGTNQYHGSAQFRLRNEALNANRFENNAQPTAQFPNGVPRAPFKQQGYAATFGGPLSIPKLYNGKDKTFFFISAEGLRFSQAVDYFRTVPTAAERRGDFSQTVTQVGANFIPVQVFDPYTVTTVGASQFQRVAFPNAIIPANRINQPMQRVAGEFPNPNRTPDDPSNVNNFYNRMPRKFDRDAINARIDQRSGNHALYGTLGNSFGNIISGNGWGDGNRNYQQQGGFIGPVNGDRNYYAAIGDTWSINPSLLVDMRVGITRVQADNRAQTFDDIDYRAYGVPSSFDSAIGLAGAVPEITAFGGGWSRLSGLNGTGYLAKIERQTNWNLNGSVTKIAGKWTHKWGGEYRNFLSNYSDARGSFWIRSGNNFTSGNIIGPLGQNINAVTAERNGSGLASYLLGAGDIQAGENAVLMALSAKYLGFYQQSDWRATSRLTVNLGLRYDVQPGPTERYNRISAISYNGSQFGSPGQLVFPGTEGRGRNLYKTQWDNWQPRVGMAYRLKDDLVIRSGFGVTYLPSNTGYFGGPYYYGNQNFAPRTTAPEGFQYGPAPAGALVNPFNQSNQLIPIIGGVQSPRYYGAGANEPRFDYEGMENGKILQWNLFTEKKIGGYVAQLGYMGARGYDLQLGRFAYNNPQDLPDSLLQTWRQSYIANNGTNPATVQVPNRFQTDPNSLINFNGVFGNRTIPQLNASYARPLLPDNLVGRAGGYYTYNSLVAQLTRNFSNGLLFNVNYVWSRTIDVWSSEAQNNNYAENAGLSTGTLDRRNFSNNYHISPNDIPHRLVASWVYEMPFGNGKRFSTGSKFANVLLGGWQVGGVFIAQSGQPQQGFGGGTGSVTGLVNRNSGVAVEVPKELQRWYTGASTADRTVVLPSGRSVIVCRYCFLKYSSDAFSGNTVQFANGNFGNDIYWWGNAATRYGDIRGNGRWNTNLSLQKNFAIGEKLRVQLSGEATNFFNNTQFQPTMNAGSGGIVATPTATQTAAGVRRGMILNDNFGTWGMSTFDPRQVELRLRLFF
jgi:trimeric autotransporter adhesin